MTLRPIALPFAALLALASLLANVWAAQGPQSAANNPAAPINLQADKLSSSDSGNQIEAIGNVEIKREQTTLKASELRVNRATQDVEAKGQVTLDDPEWKIKSADSIRMNMERETGELHNADLFLEQGHISVSGRRFEKFGGQSLSHRRWFFYHLSVRIGRAVLEIFRRADGSHPRRHGHDQKWLFLYHGCAGVVHSLWIFSAE